MSGRILADARFLTPERLSELQEHEDVQVSMVSLIENLNLSEPQPREAVVGTLTVEEARLYRDLYEAHRQLEDFTRSRIGERLSSLGEALRESDRSKPLAEILKDGPFAEGTDTPDNVRKFHRMQQRINMLHACFYYHVGERFDLHECRLGVRTRGRIVNIEPR